MPDADILTRSEDLRRGLERGGGKVELEGVLFPGIDVEIAGSGDGIDVPRPEQMLQLNACRFLIGDIQADRVQKGRRVLIGVTRVSMLVDE